MINYGWKEDGPNDSMCEKEWRLEIGKASLLLAKPTQYYDDGSYWLQVWFGGDSFATEVEGNSLEEIQAEAIDVLESHMAMLQEAIDETTRAMKEARHGV